MTLIFKSGTVHPSVQIHHTARVDCNHLEIDQGGVIGPHCIVEGERVIIGRDLWMDQGAVIGGGSCHDPMAFLKAGDFLHLGVNAQLNIARGLTIGEEVGIGIETKVFTHGAYLDELQGFPVDFAPVTIGSRVWLPNAWVNPGVEIGPDVVVAARSLVNKNLPAGCLAGGVPAKVLKRNVYPQVLPQMQREIILERIMAELTQIIPGAALRLNGCDLVCGETRFDTTRRKIVGPATEYAEMVRNQLRRHGIRFRFSKVDGRYVPW